MHFSIAVIAVNVKPSIVIALNILFKHTLEPRVLHLDFFSQVVLSSLFYIESNIKVCFSEAVIAAIDILFKHTLWPSALDLDFLLQ